MSMTENEAKVLLCQMYLPQFDEEEKQALNMAIQSIEENQEYRAIGTVEELNKYLIAKTKLEELSGHTVDVTKLIHHFCETIFEGEKHEGFCILTNEDAKQWEDYQSLGTIAELQALKEKSVAKKPIYSDFDENEDEEIIPYKAVCPSCGYEFEFGEWNDEQNHHCECGQKLNWQ